MKKEKLYISKIKHIIETIKQKLKDSDIKKDELLSINELLDNIDIPLINKIEEIDDKLRLIHEINHHMHHLPSFSKNFIEITNSINSIKDLYSGVSHIPVNQKPDGIPPIRNAYLSSRGERPPIIKKNNNNKF